MRPHPSILLLLATAASAQTYRPPRTGATVAEPAPHSTSLPVTRVSLYKNGVGFFQHTGHVSGDASVTIDFTTDQLNDVLQSLTALDLNGGRISGAGYNSTTPLDQQLKSLPLALSADTTAADFYASIRGSRVAVTAPGVSITGRLLSVEDRTAATPPPSRNGDDSDAAGNANNKEASLHFLTVVSDAGPTAGTVRTIQLTQQTSVRLLDTPLQQDVSRYLALLAGNRSQGLRHLTLQDHGTGSRELDISYISAVPVWKSTYRILFSDAHSAATSSAPASLGTATLQGWAVVDNTVGEDWNNVELALIAGRPQSFTQPLSDPIYTQRPEIPIAIEGNLAPTTHDSAMLSPKDVKMVKEEAAPPPALASPSVSKMSVGGPVRARSYTAGVAGMSGMAGGSAGGILGGLDATAAPAPPPPSYEELAESSIAPQTQTAGFDDFFQYKLSEPITIRKNESALVPILQAKVAADLVTLVAVTTNNNISQPLRALWITNTTGLTLDRGSFALIENGSFGGEGLLDPIHAGEKRLLSYAADEAVHVTAENRKSDSRLTSLTAGRGVLRLHRAQTEQVDFLIHNAAPDHRAVLLEQPTQPGLTLDTGAADAKPVETTATANRFRVEVDPGQTTHLHISAHREGITVYQLTQSNDAQLTAILNETNHNAQLEQALQPVLEARRRVADAQNAVDQSQAKLSALEGDESRERNNITALANADKASRERFVADLNKTEDAIATEHRELATRTTTLEAAQADLNNRIQLLQLNATL